MQRASSPILKPNTYRDSNDIAPSTTRPELVLPSVVNSESMDYNSRPHRLIIHQVATEYPRPPSRNNSANQNDILNQPLIKSVVRSDDTNEQRLTHEQVFNEGLMNENNSVLEAAGYDPTRAAELDADAAYALQLQEEEYSRESLAINRPPFHPYLVESDDELPMNASPFVYYPGDRQPINDQQIAARLQAQNNARSNRLHAPFRPPRQRSNTTPAQTSEADEGSSEHFPATLARFAQQHGFQNEDDSDDQGPYMNIRHPFFHFLTNRGQPFPEEFAALLRGHGSRRHRRSGNLQDTEDDFGPEDYERLLQLDETIHKNSLTNEQINTLPIENFRRTSNNSDEENKCGVCLEHFEVNETLRRFPCRHLYHKECADRWLHENNVCPICREIPVKVQQPVPNSRSHRGTNNARRPSHTHRNGTQRPTNHASNSQRNTNHASTSQRNGTNTTAHHQFRRGPTSQRPS